MVGVNRMEEMEIINNMLEQAKEHNLEMECLFSMVNLLVGGVDIEALQQACTGALYEWDI